MNCKCGINFINTRFEICLITSLWFIGCVQTGKKDLTKSTSHAISADTLSKSKEKPHDSVSATGYAFEERENVEGMLDSSVSGIYISNPQSVLKVIGAVDPVVIPGECECATVYNSDKSQVLVLYPAYGGTKFEYDVLDVKYSLSSDKREPFSLLDVEACKTESGVRLGMSETSFLSMHIGRKWEVSEKGVTKSYKFHNQYETYLAVYTFADGLLVEFRIGYDNS